MVDLMDLLWAVWKVPLLVDEMGLSKEFETAVEMDFQSVEKLVGC